MEDHSYTSMDTSPLVVAPGTTQGGTSSNHVTNKHQDSTQAAAKSPVSSETDPKVTIAIMQFRAALQELFSLAPREQIMELVTRLTTESGFNSDSKTKSKKKKNKKRATEPSPVDQGPSPKVKILEKFAAQPSAIPQTTAKGQTSARAPISASSRGPTQNSAPAPAITAAAQEEFADDCGDPFKVVQYKKSLKRARGPGPQKFRLGNGSPSSQAVKFLEVKLRPKAKTSIGPYIQNLRKATAKMEGKCTMLYQEKANAINIRTTSDATLKSLLAITELVSNEGSKLEVQVFRTYGRFHVKGVVYKIYTLKDDPKDETLQNDLECNRITIASARRIGKTNTAMLTFEGNELPRSVLYGGQYMRVFPYKPKVVRCRNCQRIGHKQDICPLPAVCGDCGREHTEMGDENDEMSCPQSTPYCQECKKEGHLASARNCPAWIEANKQIRSQWQSQRKEQPDLPPRIIKQPVPPSVRAALSTIHALPQREPTYASALATKTPPNPAPESLEAIRTDLNEVRATLQWVVAELKKLTKST